MEKKIVKLSRPLLFKDDNEKFFLAYGFVLDEEKLSDDYDKDLDAYISYLSGMHFKTAGADYFEVSYEYRGIPDWIDEDGVPHFKMDEWMNQMAEKCRGLLALTYDVVKMEIDDDTFADVVESNFFITSESLFDGQGTSDIQREKINLRG